MEVPASFFFFTHFDFLLLLIFSSLLGINAFCLIILNRPVRKDIIVELQTPAKVLYNQKQIWHLLFHPFIMVIPAKVVLWICMWTISELILTTKFKVIFITSTNFSLSVLWHLETSRSNGCNGSTGIYWHLYGQSKGPHQLPLSLWTLQVSSALMVSHSRTERAFQTTLDVIVGEIPALSPRSLLSRSVAQRKLCFSGWSCQM